MKLPARHACFARVLSVLVLLAATGACASAGTGPGTAKADLNVINADEVANVNAATALEAVQMLRPQFLRVRDQASLFSTDAGSTGPVVYVDGIRMGPPDALRNVPAMTIRSIEYIDGPEATNRFGTGHLYGAILVVLKTGVR